MRSTLIEFHRREEKPMWWRMHDWAKAPSDELIDDPGCIHGHCAVGTPAIEKRSLVQTYYFDPTQAYKLEPDDTVMFHSRSQFLSSRRLQWTCPIAN